QQRQRGKDDRQDNRQKHAIVDTSSAAGLRNCNIGHCKKECRRKSQTVADQCYFSKFTGDSATLLIGSTKTGRRAPLILNGPLDFSLRPQTGGPKGCPSQRPIC